MKIFLVALQFLTIIPVRIKHVEEEDILKSVVYFPLVGLLLGLILTGFGKFLYFLNFEEFFINIILVIFLIALTGGLHLDGLADTVDAFLSRKNKLDMLKIMRDSHIGAMGVLGIISIVLLKISFLSSISSSLKMNALVLMCILSRWALVFSMFLFPYARQEGKAKMFIHGTNLKTFIISTIITLFCVILFCKLESLAIIAVIMPITYIIGRFITNRIGGITGDTLGASNELIEVITLFSICVLERVMLWII